MFIDEKGKLFGKINLIDLFIVLVILALITVAALKFGPGTASKTVNQDNIVVKYYAEEVSTFVADKVAVGDQLLDDGRNSDLGTVTEVVLGPSKTDVPASDGSLVNSSKPDCDSIMITSEVKGQITPFGCTIANNKYGVGHSFTLRAGKTKIFLRVYDITKK